MIGDQRPRFKTAQEYVAHVEQALDDGLQPWEPATRSELEAAFELFTSYAGRWLPSPNELQQIGLPKHFGKSVTPFDELFRERFLKTLADDVDFCLALKHLIDGGRE